MNKYLQEIERLRQKIEELEKEKEVFNQAKIKIKELLQKKEIEMEGRVRMALRERDIAQRNCEILEKRLKVVEEQLEQFRNANNQLLAAMDNFRYRAERFDKIVEIIRIAQTNGFCNIRDVITQILDVITAKEVVYYK